MSKEKQNQTATEVVDIEQLRQDEHNFNKGTEEGAALMERSLKELGAGRSILIDKNGALSEYPTDFLDEWNNQLMELM